jgi:hypothetical protein
MALNRQLDPAKLAAAKVIPPKPEPAQQPASSQSLPEEAVA